MKFTRRSLIAAFAAGLALAACQPAPAPQQPLTTVRFGMLPYGDHTQAIIGVNKGFFRDVGIDLHYESIRTEQVVPFLQNGTYDIISTSPGLLLTGFEDAPNLGMFVFASNFQGFAVMARPDQGFKTVAQFRAQGMNDADAVRATIQQLRGHRFAYPPEGGVTPFIDLLLSRGGLRARDFHAVVVDDPQTVAAMRRHDADFQVGGAPSRITLQQEGFIPILSAIDLVRIARPSPDSPELAAVFPDGWATTKAYYDANKPTILRMASVSFRIVQFMNDHQADALAVHMPYLSQVTGQQFTAQQGQIIYNDLDPFVTFEQQHEWFNNPQNPMYFQNVIGAQINSFRATGLYHNHTPTVGDVVWANDIYAELTRLRDQAHTKIEALEARRASLNSAHAALLDQAKHHFEIFNYYDADRLATEAGS